ncbi:MAG: hemolysin family protein [Candidatus Merdivicinus sp.]
MVNPFLYVVVVFLIACSAFFSGTETAFASVSRIRLKYRAQNGDKRAETALRILDRFDDALSAILIGNNIVNIGSASLATTICTLYFGESLGPTISTVVMTLLVLTFGEILPKTIAKENAEPMALGVASLLLGIMTVFKPLVWFFVQLKTVAMKFFHSHDDTPSITEEELKYMIEEIEDEGVLEEHESELIQSAMDFNDITVSEILTHRVDVVAIEKTTPIEEIKNLFVSERFTRIPVYDKSIDNILGIIHDKDFFREYLRDSNFELQTVIQDVLFVPPKKRIGELLKDFQKEKAQMAIVTDQYGGTLGIITVEDILEELVGEIWDEDEEIVAEYTKIGNNRYLVNGDMKVEDFFQEVEADYIPELADATTISGWVMEKMEKVPDPGETFVDSNISVVIRKVEEQRVRQVEITILPVSNQK